MKGTVYLYPPSSPDNMQPGIVYEGSTEIVMREIPVSAIEFKNKEGKRVVSTLPFTIVWDRR